MIRGGGQGKRAQLRRYARSIVVGMARPFRFDAERSDKRHGAWSALWHPHKHRGQHDRSLVADVKINTPLRASTV